MKIKKEFNAKEEVKKIVSFIRTYYEKNHVDGAILGISGGKDSAVVAALFVEALGRENLIGLTLPCHSKENDKKGAELIRDTYQFRLYDFDLTNVFDQFIEESKKIGEFSFEDRKNSDINLKPRLRMASVYYFAALFSALEKKTYLVAGTSNKCELFVGYFTKGGDSVHDISVLANLTVEQVIAIGEVLHVPHEVLYRTPDDGLSNQSDEEKLGVTYKQIADYMNDPLSVDESERKIIGNLHNQNQHKFYIPTYQKDDEL